MSLGIESYAATKIGKIIKSNRYFFDPPKRVRRVNLIKNRVKKVVKNIKPGYLEIDSIIVYVGSTKLRFVSLVDEVTELAHQERVGSGKSFNTS
jgi:DNA-binding ferritin-like protein (Dps family)